MQSKDRDSPPNELTQEKALEETSQTQDRANDTLNLEGNLNEGGKKEIQTESTQHQNEEHKDEEKLGGDQKSGNVTSEKTKTDITKPEGVKRAENSKKSTKGPLPNKSSHEKSTKGEPVKGTSKPSVDSTKETKGKDANKTKNAASSKTDVAVKRSDSKNSQKDETHKQQSINCSILCHEELLGIGEPNTEEHAKQDSKNLDQNPEKGSFERNAKKLEEKSELEGQQGENMQQPGR